MTGTDLAVQDVIDALDGFYCHNVVVSLWADAVANRLEGICSVSTSSLGLIRRSPTRCGGEMT
jgi:hypothetical protein